MSNKANNQIDASSADSDVKHYRMVNEIWLPYDSKDPNSGSGHALLGYGEKLAMAMGCKLKLISVRGSAVGPSGYDLMTGWPCESNTLDMMVDYMKKHGVVPKMISRDIAENALVEKCKSYFGLSPYILPAFDANALLISNHITEEELTTKREQAEEKCSDLPRPRIFVSIAAPTSTEFKAFADQLNTLLSHYDAATVFISTSRRTLKKHDPDALKGHTDRLKSVVQNHKEQGKNVKVIAHEYSKKQAVHNPYLEMLAMADAVIVLGESRSMVSEAAMTGKPVYYISYENGEFLDEAKKVMGKDAERFVELDFNRPITDKTWQAYDFTDIPLQKDVDEYNQSQSCRDQHSLTLSADAISYRAFLSRTKSKTEAMITG